MLTTADLDQLSAHGIDRAEADRQLALLAHPPAPALLDRPCTVADGVLRLDEAAQERFETSGSAYLSSVRATKFVPASGAATRMFKDALAALDSTDAAPPKSVAELLAGASKFAFHPRWKDVLGLDDVTFSKEITGDWRRLLRGMLDESGLGYSQAPKAFLEFHTVDGTARTSLEQHWREAGELGLTRLHFTISPEHATEFLSRTNALRDRLGGAIDVTHSFQDPGTDTIAGDGAGGPFRDDEGKLLLRPGGHGALIRNLGKLAGNADVAIIKNIDNIAHPKLWAPTLKWKRILAGVLADELAKGFDRPVRVCGVVKNTGEPGGGPFVVGGDREPQIVESAQVDLADPHQKAVFSASTHFNPVDLVCRLTDASGKPFELEQFVDPSTVFMSRKTHLGRPLVALERPGLWNGAMAHWKTVFVEVPLETFNPVKTVNDLLKPAHQP